MQPLRPPAKFHHAPSTLKRLVRSTTSKKGTTTTTLLLGHFLGFPPVCPRGFPRYAEGWERGTPTPFRKDGDTRRRHRIGAETTRISPDLQKTTPPDAPCSSTNLTAHQYTPPRSCSHHHRLTVGHVVRLEEPRRTKPARVGSTVARGRDLPPPPEGPCWPTRQ